MKRSGAPSRHPKSSSCPLTRRILGSWFPVLISNQVNIWREIEREHAGFVEQDSLAGTSSLLNAWGHLQDSERSIMKINAKNCFHNHFDLERNGVRLLEVIRDFAHKNTSPSE